ncbi:MAG TPA: hypothetical protein VFC80_00895 [Sphaerochaeta sp.]|nr:hypothetical protein [Sphaerochaeta sp.]
MKRERPLFPTILILVIAMLVGFILLARVYVLSPILIVGIGALVLAISFFLLRFALIFDRQMKVIHERKEEQRENA